MSKLDNVENDLTLSEVLAIVKGKLAFRDTLSIKTEKEKFVFDMIMGWSNKFGWKTAK